MAIRMLLMHGFGTLNTLILGHCTTNNWKVELVKDQ